jgi:hypothetical protein
VISLAPAAGKGRLDRDWISEDGTLSHWLETAILLDSPLGDLPE